ncbi:MAG: hypothetical protein ABIK65_14725 [Candidatus Eisenbacteria bacterium]
MTTFRILFCLAWLAVWPATSAAQWFVELDLDGTVGNGPDIVDVEVNDYVDGDLWLYGPAGVYSFGFIICSFDGALEDEGFTYYIPEVWTFAPVIWNPGCYTVQATDFTFSEPIALPAMLATIHYQAAVDQTIANIVLQAGGYFDTTFGSGSVDNVGDTLATVRIGVTSTEKSSWGAVKGLFR